jgi:hypothetical protein
MLKIDVKPEYVTVHDQISEIKTISYTFTTEEFRKKLGITKSSRKERKKESCVTMLGRHISLLSSAITSGKWVSGRPVENWGTLIDSLLLSWENVPKSDLYMIKSDIIQRLTTIVAFLNMKGMPQEQSVKNMHTEILLSKKPKNL